MFVLEYADGRTDTIGVETRIPDPKKPKELGYLHINGVTYNADAEVSELIDDLWFEYKLRSTSEN